MLQRISDFVRPTAALWALAGLLAGTALAGGGAVAETQAVVIAPAAETVYLDIGGLGRKNRAAEKLTVLHRQRAAAGWTFASLDPYLENGDLQGFWVTYVETRP
ncbi:MAG: hypothetical protein M5U13_13990 [Thermoanaerobaculia bacterium]|nr:hypothetical protein [Thermoanaerobaculia bacterium]